MVSAPNTKETRLHIRASSQQKALLARAARARHINVSQFVLQTSLEAAQKLIAQEQEAQAIRVSAQHHDWLMQKLEEPPQEISELRELLLDAPRWNEPSETP